MRNQLQKLADIEFSEFIDLYKSQKREAKKQELLMTKLKNESFYFSPTLQHISSMRFMMKLKKQSNEALIKKQEDMKR